MKQLIKVLDEHVKMYKDPRTGLVWIENGRTGLGHSAHPNISDTGSVTGMKRLGYWREKDRTVRSHGFIYNVDHVVISDELDRKAALACQCIACRCANKATPQYTAYTYCSV